MQSDDKTKNSKSNKKKFISIVCIAILIVCIAGLLYLKTFGKRQVECSTVSVKFNIIYNINDEALNESKLVEKINSELLPIPQKDSYIFSGWYYDEDFNDKVEGDSIKDLKLTTNKDVNGCIINYNDINLYAKWLKDENEEEEKRIINSNDNLSSSSSYSCASYGNGYVLNGDKCYKYDYKELKNRSFCEDDGILEGDNLCHFYNQLKDKSVCGADYTYNGQECYRSYSTTEDDCLSNGGVVTNRFEGHEILICLLKKESSCPIGYKYSEGKCHKTSTPRYDYFCEDGYQIDSYNGRCIKLVDTKKAKLENN